MFGKIIDGNLVLAGQIITTDKGFISNPKAEQLIELGYKEIDYAEKPEYDKEEEKLQEVYTDGDKINSSPWLPRPWDSPGKNTGAGCHFLLQCMKVKSESEVARLVRLFRTPWTAAYQAPLSMGFSRQEYWSGVPLPSPILKAT